MKEQLRDLMFYIDGQQKLKGMADVSVEELENSQVTVNSPSGNAQATNNSTPTTTNKSRRRKK